jgi:hypothetical protein
MDPDDYPLSPKCGETVHDFGRRLVELKVRCEQLFEDLVGEAMDDKCCNCARLMRDPATVICNCHILKRVCGYCAHQDEAGG